MQDEFSRELLDMPMTGEWPWLTWTWEESFSLMVMQNFDDDEIVFTATIPNNTYLAIAFGHDMIGSDMILWQANGDESAVHDLWSSNFATPVFDKFNHWKSEISDGKIGTGQKIFKSRRAFDSMDDQDFLIPKGE